MLILYSTVGTTNHKVTNNYQAPTLQQQHQIPQNPSKTTQSQSHLLPHSPGPNPIKCRKFGKEHSSHKCRIKQQHTMRDENEISYLYWASYRLLRAPRIRAAYTARSHASPMAHHKMSAMCAYSQLRRSVGLSLGYPHTTSARTRPSPAARSSPIMPN